MERQASRVGNGNGLAEFGGETECLVKVFLAERTKVGEELAHGVGILWREGCRATKEKR